jgi:hypothetical protein
MLDGVLLQAHSAVLLLTLRVNLAIECCEKLFEPLKLIHERLKQLLLLLSEFPSKNIQLLFNFKLNQLLHRTAYVLVLFCHSRLCVKFYYCFATYIFLALGRVDNLLFIFVFKSALVLTYGWNIAWVAIRYLLNVGLNRFVLRVRGCLLVVGGLHRDGLIRLVEIVRDLGKRECWLLKRVLCLRLHL